MQASPGPETRVHNRRDLSGPVLPAQMATEKSPARKQCARLPSNSLQNCRLAGRLAEFEQKRKGCQGPKTIQETNSGLCWTGREATVIGGWHTCMAGPGRPGRLKNNANLPARDARKALDNYSSQVSSLWCSIANRPAATSRARGLLGRRLTRTAVGHVCYSR
jgi:hypothetical protein